MSRTLPIIALSGLFATAGVVIALTTLGSGGLAQTPPSVDEQRPFMEIAYDATNGGGIRRCYSDAFVVLVDGIVSEVAEVSPGVADNVRPGTFVEELPSGFDRGRSEFAVPVHLDSQGKLVGGYSECVEINEDPR